ncbi:SPOR domain-containing protein [Marinifilum sp. RC60d5]|uniref:SPOR domain-containing protein n=1 Tax=Marinifilum sp. RC60d5 TaxID=3458414 RepID=UPI0040371255
MARFSFLLIPVLLLLVSCNDKKSVTTVNKKNIVEQTVKRQVPKLAPSAVSSKSVLTDVQIAKNRDTFNYHIVAASYTNKKQATAFKSRLYQKGYPSIVLEKNGKYRVILQSFNTKKSALKELYRLRKLNKKPDLWLLKQ